MAAIERKERTQKDVHGRTQPRYALSCKPLLSHQHHYEFYSRGLAGLQSMKQHQRSHSNGLVAEPSKNRRMAAVQAIHNDRIASLQQFKRKNRLRGLHFCGHTYHSGNSYCACRKIMPDGAYLEPSSDYNSETVAQHQFTK